MEPPNQIVSPVDLSLQWDRGLIVRMVKRHLSEHSTSKAGWKKTCAVKVLRL